jgi:hypothetical protein
MAVDVREIGIPVRGVNWVRLFAGRQADGTACLYATMGQESAPLFVLQIDPATGQLRQFDADHPEANAPPATHMAPDERLYVGAAYAGRLLCFDPDAGAANDGDLLDLGAIHPEAATFPCRIDTAPDGGVWIGSYPTADLTRFDPATGEFTRYGRVDDVDMYNYPLVNTDGTVANLVRVTRSFVVVLDPASGTRRPVGPVAVQGQDSLDLWRSADGSLIIESSLGHFRLDGFDAVPIDEVPARERAATLPDGTTFDFADAGEQSFRQLRLRPPGQEPRIVELDYRADGSRLFLVHEGPDDRIYGSSVMPLHMFRWDPAVAGDGGLVDLGRCSSATGEAYSMANHDGRLYIASYPRAVLSVYDPAQPYRFGDDEAANPRDLGRIDELSYRPRSALAGPLDRVWFASVPDYGRWGGPLAWYDPATGERHAYEGLAGDGSCYTLAWLRDAGLLAVGLSVEGGTGTQPKIDDAGLFLWDYETETKVWEGHVPGADVLAVIALVVARDGSLVGLARRRAAVEGEANGTDLFRFDPATRVVTDVVSLPEESPDLALRTGPDGEIVGFTLACLFRVDLKPFGFEELLRDDETHLAFRTPGPVRRRADGRREVLFARTHRLMAATLTD